VTRSHGLTTVSDTWEQVKGQTESVWSVRI